MYCLFGDAYLTGDLNSIVGHKTVYVNNINLDHYVYLTDSDLNVQAIPPRVLRD